MTSNNIFKIKQKIESKENSNNLGLRLQLATTLYEIMVQDRVKFWASTPERAEKDVTEKFFHIACEVLAPKKNDKSSDLNLIKSLDYINDHVFPYTSNGTRIEGLDSIDYVSIEGFETELSEFLGKNRYQVSSNYRRYEIYKTALILLLGMCGYLALYFGIQGPTSGIVLIVAVPITLFYSYRLVEKFLVTKLFKK